MSNRKKLKMANQKSRALVLDEVQIYVENLIKNLQLAKDENEIELLWAVLVNTAYTIGSHIKALDEVREAVAND